MTNLLKEAFDKASELPQKEQDTFARFLLAKLESEAQWADAFARSQDVLAKLADEALEEFIAGSGHSELSGHQDIAYVRKLQSFLGVLFYHDDGFAFILLKTP